jgi:predicted enzyme related to lactoylglutathione lyase
VIDQIPYRSARPEEFIMTAGMHTVIYPVTDLPRAKALFAALLGTEPVMDEPYYVQFGVDGQAVGLDPHGHRDGPVGYWHVDDVRAAVERLRAAGAEVVQDVRDVGGGTLVAVLADGDGNPIGLRQTP